MVSLPRRPQGPWEPYVISGFMTAFWVVLIVCGIILTIAVLLFSLAELKAHWP